MSLVVPQSTPRKIEAIEVIPLSSNGRTYVKPQCSPKNPSCGIRKPDCSPKKVACPEPCPPKKVECLPKKEECPPKKPACPEPCPKQECDPCKSSGYTWSWLGALVLWFVIFTLLFWLIYYSLQPSFVLQSDSNQVDTAKVLLAAVISALILVLIVWLIKMAIARR